MFNQRDAQIFINNQEIYRYYFDRLIQVALSQFKYKNLPVTCNRLYFEKKMLFDGTAIMMTTPGLDEIMSIGYVNTGGKFDIYGWPISPTGIGYQAANIPVDKYVIFFDNMLMNNRLLYYIDLYAKLLWEIHMTIRSNLKFQNIPYIVRTDPDLSYSVEQLFKRVDNFDPVIKMKKNRSELNPDLEINSLDLKVDFRGNELHELLDSIWSEALGFLGLTTKLDDKKERMVSFEAESDKETTEVSLENRLTMRKESLEKFNEIFKDNPYYRGEVTVELNKDMQSDVTKFVQYGESTDKSEEEGGSDE